MERCEKWDEQSAARKVAVMLLVSLQVSLAVSAWADLAEREADEVHGSKTLWAIVIAISFVGPTLYFVRGRDRQLIRERESATLAR